MWLQQRIDLIPSSDDMYVLFEADALVNVSFLSHGQCEATSSLDYGFNQATLVPEFSLSVSLLPHFQDSAASSPDASPLLLHELHAASLAASASMSFDI